MIDQPNISTMRSSLDLTRTPLTLMHVPHTTLNLAAKLPPDEGMRLLALARASLSQGTIRGYGWAAKRYLAWCDELGLVAAPATSETLHRYLIRRKEPTYFSTAKFELQAICKLHAARGYESPYRPDIQLLMKGIARLSPPQEGKWPLSVLDIKAISDLIDRDQNVVRGRRDRAMLLLGFAAALRRSELVGLEIDHLRFELRGLTIHIVRSKTDPEGTGHYIAVPYAHTRQYCPVRSLQAWLRALNASRGPVFRRVWQSGKIGAEKLSPQSFCSTIQRYAIRIGLDPSHFGAHSVRSGFCVSSLDAGASAEEIRRVTRHKSLKGLDPYLRHASLFALNTTALLGL